jgi:hypothetical protein
VHVGHVGQHVVGVHEVGAAALGHEPFGEVAAEKGFDRLDTLGPRGRDTGPGAGSMPSTRTPASR